MYANRDNSANYGSLLQIQRLMSNREMFGRAEDFQFLPFQGDEFGGGNKRCPLTSDFEAKKFTERAFVLPYFSPRPAVIKLIVQRGYHK